MNLIQAFIPAKSKGWEGDKEVECTEVKPVQKTVTVYEPV